MIETLSTGQKAMLRQVALGHINDMGGVPKEKQRTLFTGERLILKHLTDKGLVEWSGRHVVLTAEGEEAVDQLGLVRV